MSWGRVPSIEYGGMKQMSDCMKKGKDLNLTVYIIEFDIFFLLISQQETPNLSIIAYPQHASPVVSIYISLAPQKVYYRNTTLHTPHQINPSRLIPCFRY